MIIEKSQHRILFASLGSLGDLHPVIGMALELKRRGHIVCIASTPFYREKIEGFGLGFRPLRPDWNPQDTTLIAQCEDMRRGTEILLRKLVLPHLRDTYDDLLAAADGMDMMIAGEMVYPAPLVAEKLRLTWGSAILSPCTLFSVYDPPVLPNVPELRYLRWMGPGAHRVMLRMSSLAIDHWWKPIRELRTKEGLEPGRNPLFADKFSPELVLALFSHQLARPQLDWPANTVQPGFVLHDQSSAGEALSGELESFLANGAPPIVFTQGSTAVYNPGNFYAESIQAARKLGQRALLVGADETQHVAGPDIFVTRYAPYSEVFSRCAVIVHQGGAGTTGMAMRTGKPMLIVPYGWDQPDQAARIVRMGAGLTMTRKRYSAERAEKALRRLLEEESFVRRAGAMRDAMQAEDGRASACDAIEEVLMRQVYCTSLLS
jgi:UDP:flavonoid glycosyltransferase YjiC (YdhE family)